jgi:glycopeptide antibiotics resistance protein
VVEGPGSRLVPGGTGPVSDPVNGRDRRRIVLTAVFIAYVLFLFDIALFRFPIPDPRPNFVPFRSILHDVRAGGRNFVINFLGNLFAFVPMGLIPPLILRRRITPRQVALFSLTLSLMIEVPQFLTGRRVADVDDLILNTAGGLLGYAMVVLVRGRSRSHGSR